MTKPAATGPTWSPKGDEIAFVSDRDGPFDILVGQIDSREFRNVTKDGDESALQKDVRAPVRSVGFTGDGTELWFGGGSGQRLRTMPFLGGSAGNFLGETAEDDLECTAGILTQRHVEQRLFVAVEDAHIARGDLDRPDRRAGRLSWRESG